MVHICVDQCGFSNKEFLQKIVVQHYVPGSSESMIKKTNKNLSISLQNLCIPPKTIRNIVLYRVDILYDELMLPSLIYIMRALVYEQKSGCTFDKW